MNRDELSRMLDMVDEKFLEDIPDNSRSVTAIKRKSFHGGFACVAAAAVMIFALSFFVSREDISVDERQGAVTDTEIILIDEEDNYDELFAAPLDIGGVIFAEYDLGDKVYCYSEDIVRNMLPYNVTAFTEGEFALRAEAALDEKGELVCGNIYLNSPNGSPCTQCFLAVLDDQSLAKSFTYAGMGERYGKKIYTCYCEKTDGLHLWGFFENDGKGYVISSVGLERNKAGIIFDSLLTGIISFDEYTADNADSMRCTMSLDDAALLPGFEGRILTKEVVGDMYLRDDSITHMKLFRDGETACELLYSVIYTNDGVSNAAITYYIGGFETVSDYTQEAVTVDISEISEITREQLFEWSRFGSYYICIKSEDICISITLNCSAENAEAILKAVSEQPLAKRKIPE